jgi:transcriptional regulator with XRE-family HTH domain
MSATDQMMGVDRERRPSPIDVHVGARIRLRRTLLGMSQEQLGEALGLTFQQVQKYERGANRVSASRLFDLSRVADVPISFFFDDMPEHLASAFGAPPLHPQYGPVEASDGLNDQTLNRRETLELARAYYRITDASIRKRVFELIKSMGPTDQQAAPPPVAAHTPSTDTAALVKDAHSDMRHYRDLVFRASAVHSPL